MNRYEFTGKTLPIYTVGGVKVATEHNRIVHGGRGAYVEFLDEQVTDNLVVTPGSEWRLDPEHPAHDQCYFALYNPKGEVKTRIYHQHKTVDYADYVVGRWYISPTKLQDFEVVGKYAV